MEMVGTPALAGTHWLRYIGAGLLTLLSVLIVGVLWRKLAAIPDPGLLLLFTVALSTYLAGGMAGMLSAAIVLFCSFILFSHPVYPFRYSDLDWRQMMVIVIASPLIALMVGSLREQVERLKAVTQETEALRGEIRRLEMVKDAHYVCERRFQLTTAYVMDYAICALDIRGLVTNWNPGAERLVGYSDLEILGQSYSRFFTKEDILARRPERMLEVARFLGRAEEEGWRVRKGGGRFRTSLALLTLNNAAGNAVGFLLIMRDLTAMSEAHEFRTGARADPDAPKPEPGSESQDLPA